jgi:hypothetical protein
MTGGRLNAEQREEPPRQSRPKLRLLEGEGEVESALRSWGAATKFRARAAALLRPYGVTFALFRVLHVTFRLQRELGDAVSQRDVAVACALHWSTICPLIRGLEARRLLDIGYDQWGYAQRIVVTRWGSDLLASSRGALAKASRDAGLRR